MRRSLLKDAVAVGFGLAFGKELGTFCFEIIAKAFVKWGERGIRDKAKEGLSSAQEYCEKWGLKWDEDSVDEELKED